MHPGTPFRCLEKQVLCPQVCSILSILSVRVLLLLSSCPSHWLRLEMSDFGSHKQRRLFVSVSAPFPSSHLNLRVPSSVCSMFSCLFPWCFSMRFKPGPRRRPSGRSPRPPRPPKFPRFPKLARIQEPQDYQEPKRPNISNIALCPFGDSGSVRGLGLHSLFLWDSTNLHSRAPPICLARYVACF